MVGVVRNYIQRGSDGPYPKCMFCKCCSDERADVSVSDNARRI